MNNKSKLYADDLPYFKTSTSAPDGWIEKAKAEIIKAGGKVTGEAFASDGYIATFMLLFLWFQLDPELVLSDILSDKKLNIYTSSHKRYIYPNPPVIKDWHRNPDDEKAFLVSAIAISVILSAFSVSTYFSIGFPDWTVIVLPIMAFIFMVICAIILIKTLSRAL